MTALTQRILLALGKQFLPVEDTWISVHKNDEVNVLVLLWIGRVFRRVSLLYPHSVSYLSSSNNSCQHR